MVHGLVGFAATRPRRLAAALGLGAVLLLSGCTTGGDTVEDTSESGSSEEASSSSTPSESESVSESPSDPEPETPTAEAEPYLDVPPDVELTPAGAQLSLGEPATVAYQPKQGTVGVVRLAVTGIERGRIKDLAAYKLDAETRRSTPYYVRGVVRNTGETDLGGTMLPLYLADDENRFVMASGFRSTFEKCPSTPFPRGFEPGERERGCWVYLAGEGTRLTGISYYPVDGFDAITWTGEVTGPRAKRDGRTGRRAGNRDG